jgi:hypothetical protein
MSDWSATVSAANGCKRGRLRSSLDHQFANEHFHLHPRGRL